MRLILTARSRLSTGERPMLAADALGTLHLPLDAHVDAGQGFPSWLHAPGQQGDALLYCTSATGIRCAVLEIDAMSETTPTLEFNGFQQRALAVPEELDLFLGGGRGGGKADRVSGWNRMRRLLSHAGKPDRPGLYIARRCRYFWDTVPMLARDAKRIEDVDTTGPDQARTRSATDARGRNWGLSSSSLGSGDLRLPRQPPILS